MQKDTAISFLFVSEILGRKVAGADGRAIGKAVDLVASAGEMYPLVWGLVVDLHPGGRKVARRCRPPSCTRSRAADRSGSTPRASGISRSARTNFLIRDLLLDKQIVDVQGAKVERVNDVHLLVTDRALDRPRRRRLHRACCAGSASRARSAPLWRVTGRPARRRADLLEVRPAPRPSPRSPGRPIRLKVEHAQIRDLHPGELADILEDLGKDERAMIVHSARPRGGGRRARGGRGGRPGRGHLAARARPSRPTSSRRWTRARRPTS